MAKSAGWRAGAGIGGAALLLSIGCDDVRTVDAVQSPRDVGAAVDLGPIDDAGSAGQDAAGADASPGADAGPGPDAARCDPPAPPLPAPPSGTCLALSTPGGTDPFAAVPCEAPVPVPGLSAPAQVVYTAFGVPHVYAASVTDALRLQGYLVARDRFFQMELTRRNTLGLLSGWLSGLALSTDIENRTAGQAQAARRTYEAGTSPDDADLVRRLRRRRQLLHRPRRRRSGTPAGRVPHPRRHHHAAEQHRDDAHVGPGWTSQPVRRPSPTRWPSMVRTSVAAWRWARRKLRREAVPTRRSDARRWRKTSSATSRPIIHVAQVGRRWQKPGDAPRVPGGERASRSPASARSATDGRAPRRPVSRTSRPRRQRQQYVGGRRGARQRGCRLPRQRSTPEPGARRPSSTRCTWTPPC
jgi:hypothetical protein